MQLRISSIYLYTVFNSTVAAVSLVMSVHKAFCLCRQIGCATYQSKQFMTVKRGSIYYDKQHMLRYASWCNDVVMPDSLTSAHSLRWPFMTELIDSHMH